MQLIPTVTVYIIALDIHTGILLPATTNKYIEYRMWVGRSTHSVFRHMHDGIQQEILERFDKFDFHRCTYSFLLHINMI